MAYSVIGKNETEKKKLPFSNAGRVEGRNVFKSSPGVPRFVANAIITPYDL